jgi:hypothetical protein
MRKIVLDADFEISRNPAAGRSLIAGVFMETDEDGLTTVKNSGSTFENIDISNNANASYIHDLIFDGTVSIKILGNGGEAITLQSDILTAAHLTVVESLITGNMDSVNGYDIDEYQLIYKLIVWEYITPTFIKTIKPYVVYNDVNNSNDATTALNYAMPITKMTANKGAMAITSDPLAIVWSDGAVRDCGGVDAARTGAGVGFVYLVGNYSKLLASSQGISVVDFFSDDLEYLNLSSNAVNITTVLLSNINSLIELNLSNTTSTVDDLAKFTGLKIINLSNSNGAILNNSIQNNSVIKELEITNTSSVINNNVLENKSQLTKLSVANTTSVIENLNSAVLVSLNVGNTLSALNPSNPSTLLSFVSTFSNNSIFTDSNKNKFLNLLQFFCGNNANFSLTDTTFSDLTNMVILSINGSDATINTSSVVNKNSLIRLEIRDCKGEITAVNTATIVVNVAGLSNQTVTSNNSLIQDLVNRTRTGIRQLTYDDDAGLDQSNLDILEARGWELTAVV